MYINEIIWYFSSSSKNTHNNILWYGNIENDVRIEYFTEKNGIYLYYKKKYGEERAKKEYGTGQSVKNTWIDIVSNKMNRKANDYPTQKPYKLLERIICLGTK